MPAFNEERRLPRLLDTLERDADEVAAAAGFALVEVIVVDDGSTDGTSTLLAARRALGGRLRAMRLERNRGKGAAVRTGMLAAAGTHGLLTDADLSTPLGELAKLSSAVAAGADVVLGSRGLPASRIIRRQPPYRELPGKTFNWMLRLLTGLPYRDTQCGFKLFRLETARVLFERQRIEGFAFDAEICVLARQLGLSTVELPVVWAHDPDTRVGLVRASAQMGRDLLRIAWTGRVRRWS